MPATTNVNQRTVVHANSGGICMGMPDVCQTPTPGGPVPIPYPNIAKSQDTAMGSSTVTVDGQPIVLKDSCFALSTGDEAGSAGGVLSGIIKGKAEFINYSFDVMVEGKNVCRLGDMMLLNNRNTPPMPEVQPPLVVLPSFAVLPSESESETKDWDLTKLEFEEEGDDESEAPPGTASAGEDIVYDEQIQLVDEVTGKPLANYPFVILCNGQVMERGSTDENGMAPRVESGKSESKLTIVWGYDALTWS